MCVCACVRACVRGLVRGLVRVRVCGPAEDGAGVRGGQGSGSVCLYHTKHTAHTQGDTHTQSRGAAGGNARADGHLETLSLSHTAVPAPTYVLTVHTHNTPDCHQVVHTQKCTGKGGASLGPKTKNPGGHAGGEG